MSLVEDAVEAAIKIAIDLIHDRVSQDDDREQAMMLLADRMRLRAMAQARLNARKKELDK